MLLTPTSSERPVLRGRQVLPPICTLDDTIPACCVDRSLSLRVECDPRNREGRVDAADGYARTRPRPTPIDALESLAAGDTYVDGRRCMRIDGYRSDFSVG